jgi:metal-sulfur cluster biosynthetic enzyme
MIDKAEVDAALAAIYDPCSVQANAAISIADMGLVTALNIEGDAVRMRIRATSPWCTMIGSIMQAIETKVGAVAGVRTVAVEIERETNWSEADLSPQGRETLQGARARSRAAYPVRPRQWQERIPKGERNDGSIG